MPTKHNSENTTKKEKFPSVFSEISRNRSVYNMLAPFLVLFVLFTVVPLLGAIPMAFFDWELPNKPVFSGIENFKLLFTDNSQFTTALKNTLYSLLITGLGGFVLITIVAFLVSELKKPFRTVFAVILSLPSFIYGSFAVWGLFTGNDASAPLNGFMLSLGAITDTKDWLNEPVTSMLLTQLAKLWSTFGIGFLAVLAGFEKKENELYDAAKIDGVANRIHQFFIVTVPAAAPHLCFAAVLQISVAFGTGSAFTTTDENMTLTDYMLRLTAHNSDIGSANAVCIIIAAISVAMYFIVRKLFGLIEDKGV